MTKSATESKRPRKQHSPEFRNKALKLAKRIGVDAAVRQLSLYDSQVYAECSKMRQENELPAENAHLNCKLAERDEELTILWCKSATNRFFSTFPP